MSNPEVKIKYTGRWYFKRGFFGNLSLYIQIEEFTSNTNVAEVRQYFRKATEEDIINFDIILK